MSDKRELARLRRRVKSLELAVTTHLGLVAGEMVEVEHEVADPRDALKHIDRSCNKLFKVYQRGAGGAETGDTVGRPTSGGDPA